MDQNDSVRVHPTAEVSPHATIGVGTVIWNNAQIREHAIVGRGCSVGKDVYLDIGVTVGNGVKIQNGVSVYAGVTVEDDVFLGPHMTFTNDLYPRAFHTDWQITPTLVKRGASIGANATVVCGNVIGAYAMVGAGCVVTRDIPDHGLAIGNPMRISGYVCRCGHKACSPGLGSSAAVSCGRLTCETCGESFEI